MSPSQVAGRTHAGFVRLQIARSGAHAKTGKVYTYYQLTVPAEIAKDIPDVNVFFKPEITPDGILFRPVGRVEIHPPDTWIVEKKQSATPRPPA